MKTNDFLGNEWTYDCMGCAISSGLIEVPGGLLHRTDSFIVHQDPLITIPGFLVIATIRHIKSISEMSDVEYKEFSNLVKTTHHAVKEFTKVNSLTIIQEESSKHFHLWFFPWTKEVIEQYGNPSLTKIRAIMEDYRNKTIGEAKWRDLRETIEMTKIQMEE